MNVVHMLLGLKDLVNPVGSMFDLMGIPDTAEREIQQFPGIPFLFIEFGGRKLIGYIIAPYMGFQGDTVPEDSGIVPEGFHGHIVHNRIFVPNTAALYDFQFAIFFP